MEVVSSVEGAAGGGRAVDMVVEMDVVGAADLDLAHIVVVAGIAELEDVWFAAADTVVGAAVVVRALDVNICLRVLSSRLLGRQERQGFCHT